MTRDKLVQLLGWRLGDRDDLVEKIIAEMDYVQTMVLEENQWLPWFLETELAEASTTPGENRVTLPEDFLGEIEESHLWIVTGDGQSLRLRKGEYDILKAQYPGEGQPQRYCISHGYFHLFPAPDQTYTLQMRYYARDVLMSLADVETRWLKFAGDVVMAAIGKEMSAKHLQNPTLAASFTADLATAWTRLLTKHTSLSEINLARSMNGEVQ